MTGYWTTFNATFPQQYVAPVARTSNKQLAETVVAPVSKRRGRPPLSAEQKQPNKETKDHQKLQTKQ